MLLNFYICSSCILKVRRSNHFWVIWLNLKVHMGIKLYQLLLRCATSQKLLPSWRKNLALLLTKFLNSWRGKSTLQDDASRVHLCLVNIFSIKKAFIFVYFYLWIEYKCRYREMSSIIEDWGRPWYTVICLSQSVREGL